MQRFGFDEGRVLSALVFDQDTLNDLLISTSIGSSSAPLAMRGSNMSSIRGVSEGDGYSVRPRGGRASMQAVRLVPCFPDREIKQRSHLCAQNNPTVATVALPEDWAARLRYESGEDFAHCQACCMPKARAISRASASALRIAGTGCACEPPPVPAPDLEACSVPVPMRCIQ